MADKLSLKENREHADQQLATKETPAGAQAKVDAHVAEPDPHPQYSKVGHTHPTDTSRAPVDSPSFTGNSKFDGGAAPIVGLTATLNTSGAVGGNLAPNQVYRYQITFVINGVETLASEHAGVATGNVAYPISLAWPWPPAGTTAVRIYKNGRFFTQLAANSINHMDNGMIATGATVPPTDSNSVAAAVSKFFKWTGSIFGTALASLNKVSAADNMTYTIIDKDAKVYRAVYNDLAELFEKQDGVVSEPGDILISTDNKVCLSTQEGDRRVVGVHSDTYGFCLGGENKDSPVDNYDRFIPVGISGRVRVKIVGEVVEGDLIVASQIPGVGIATSHYVPGTVVGKALEASHKPGVKRVWMLIMNT